MAMTKSLVRSTACLLGAVGLCVGAQAQPGESAIEPSGSVLPRGLELAIESSAPTLLATNMMRSAVLRSMIRSPLCYKADLTPEQWTEALNRFQFLPPTQAPMAPNDPFGDRFSVDTYRWGPGGTASTAFPSGAAAAANLTFSFPADSTTWGLSASGFATGPNVLGASLSSQFGSTEVGREYLRQCLASWRKYIGITYTEVADDNVAMNNVSTHTSLRGDIRLGGLALGTSSGVLAYNCFPSTSGLAGSLGGGDMVVNTSWFGDASTFNSSANNYRYFRNVCTHEHGHGLGCIHPVPCNSTKLMEPFIQTSTDGVQHDDRRAGTRNYGDRYSGNQSLAAATDFGNLTSPTVRSIGCRELSLNGYWNNGANATGADYFSFTLSSAQDVKIITTPKGGSYVVGQQSSSCSGTTKTYNSLALGDLAYVLTDSTGTVTIGSVDTTGPGSAESFTFSGLPAGKYVLRVYDNNSANPTNGSDPNTIVQLYDLEIQVGTNVYEDPYANAGVHKRIAANTVCQFIGDVNSEAVEKRVATTISRYEWDLDGDGVFETGVSPQPSAPKPTFTYKSNGVYGVKLRVRDSNGKTSTDTIQVSVYGATTTITGSAVSGVRGTTVPFTLTGTNLKNLTSASMVSVAGGDVSTIGTPVPNALGTSVSGLSFQIGASAATGPRTVSVSNADGSASSSGLLTVTMPPCPADLNGDGQVDDSDFVIFSKAYDIFLCTDASMPAGCPSDFSANGQVDDEDFVIFALAYDAFVCP